MTNLRIGAVLEGNDRSNEQHGLQFIGAHEYYCLYGVSYCAACFPLLGVMDHTEFTLRTRR
jgi:hypothetical protein